MSDNRPETFSAMLDLETFSVESDGAIIEIGCIAFNSKFEMVDSFHVHIDPVSAMMEGGTVDNDTVAWWKSQGYDFSASRANIKDALREFRQFYKKMFDDTSPIWANSPAFDCVMLRNALTRSGFSAPWRYSNERDLRTMKKVVGSGLVFSTDEPKHNALNDCIDQLIQLKEINEFMRGGQG